MIILNYRDDGPSGICGQAMYITSFKNQLYIVDNVKEAKELEKEVSKIKHRKNPRIEHFWDDSLEDIIDKRKEG